MAINDEGRQAAIAGELEASASRLAHSTRDVSNPSDSYTILGELRASIDSLEEVCRHLSAWHSNVVDGVHYAGEDDRGDGATGTVTAAAELEAAARSLDAASRALGRAHSANGVVRWYDSPR